MEKQKNKDFDFSVFWHNFTRTFPRMIWIPLFLCLGLGAWRYYWSVRSYVPMYELTAVYRVSAGQTGNIDIGSNFGFYIDANTASGLASSYPYVMSSDYAKELLREKLGQPALPAGVTCRAESTLLVFSASGSDPDNVYTALKTVEELFPEAALPIRGSFTLDPFDELTVPTAPVNAPAPIRAAAKGAALGFALGLALICVFALFRKTVHNSEDLRELLNTPCLGLLPKVRFKARTKQDNTILLSNPHLDESYTEARRLLKFLNYFLPIPADVVPLSSIMREFIGGGCYKT